MRYRGTDYSVPIAYEMLGIETSQTEATATATPSNAAANTGAQGATGEDTANVGSTGVGTTEDAPTGATVAKPRKTRDGSKQAALIAMLRRPNGATIDEIANTFSWRQHTVRGAIAGALKKKLGLDVTSYKIDERGRVYRLD